MSERETPSQLRFKCDYCTGHIKHVPGCPEIEREHQQSEKAWSAAAMRLNDRIQALERERAGLMEALEAAAQWHDSHRDDLSKMPPSADRNWRRCEHEEERDRINAALAAADGREKP